MTYDTIIFSVKVKGWAALVWAGFGTGKAWLGRRISGRGSIGWVVVECWCRVSVLDASKRQEGRRVSD